MQQASRTRLLLAATASALLAGVGARDARALGPVDLEVGAKGGFATNPTSSPPNPLGGGAGARAGVSLFGLYGGVDIMDYVGSSQGREAGESVSERAWMAGVELGYGLQIARFTLRPQLGLGNLQVTTSETIAPCNLCALPIVTNSSSRTNNLYLEPGITGLVSFGVLFLGADVNLLVIPHVENTPATHLTESALTLHGQLGVRF